MDSPRDSTPPENSTIVSHPEEGGHPESSEISQWKLILLLACAGFLTNLCIAALLLKQNQNFVSQETQKTQALAKNRQFLEEVNIPLDQLVRELVALHPPGLREIFVKYGLAGPLSMLPKDKPMVPDESSPKARLKPKDR